MEQIWQLLCCWGFFGGVGMEGKSVPGVLLPSFQYWHNYPVHGYVSVSI